MKALGTPVETICPNCGCARVSASIKGETQCSNCKKYYVFDRKRWHKYKEEWKTNNPEKYKARVARHNKKLSILYVELRDKFENKCDLCDATNQRLEFHEINGKPHPLNSVYIKNHIDDFVLLCKPCHDATHWANEKTGMAYSIFKRKISPFL